MPEIVPATFAMRAPPPVPPMKASPASVREPFSVGRYRGEPTNWTSPKSRPRSVSPLNRMFGRLVPVKWPTPPSRGTTPPSQYGELAANGLNSGAHQAFAQQKPSTGSDAAPATGAARMEAANKAVAKEERMDAWVCWMCMGCPFALHYPRTAFWRQWDKSSYPNRNIILSEILLELKGRGGSAIIPSARKTSTTTGYVVRVARTAWCRGNPSP